MRGNGKKQFVLWAVVEYDLRPTARVAKSAINTILNSTNIRFFLINVCDYQTYVVVQ